MDGLIAFWSESGIANFTGGQLFMMGVGALLLYLAIVKRFEPLLLLPIGFGAILANIPNGGFTDEGVTLLCLSCGDRNGHISPVDLYGSWCTYRLWSPDS